MTTSTQQATTSTLLSAPLRAVVGLVSVLVVVVLAYVGLYALSAEPERVKLLAALGAAWPYLAASIPGGFAAVYARSVHRNVAAVGGDVAVVKQQTNGALRAAVTDIVESALDRRGFYAPDVAADTAAQQPALPADPVPAQAPAPVVEQAPAATVAPAAPVTGQAI